MKSILRSAFAVLFAFSSSSVFAANFSDMGILAGYRVNDATSKVTGTSVDGDGGFQVGGLAFLPLGEVLSLRTGFIYAQRNYTAKDSTGSSDIELAHFDVPVGIMYNIADMGGLFVGGSLGLKIKDECGGSDCSGVKSVIVPIQVGAHFKIAPQFAGEVYFETAPGEIMDGLEDASAVVVNAMFTFE